MQTMYRISCLVALAGMLLVLPGATCIPVFTLTPTGNGGSGDDNTPVDITGFNDQLVELVNSERTANGVAAVVKNAALTQAAQDYAERMAEKGFVADTDPYNGSKPEDRATQAGYVYGYLAENVGSGFTSPQDVLDDWMSSTSHSDNVLWSKVTETGVGVAQDSATGKVYWVEMFGSPE